MAIKPRLPLQLGSRSWIFLGLTGLVALLLLGQYAWIMLFPPVGATPGLTFTQVERGPILDREGRLLAVTNRVDTATVWRPQLQNPQQEAAQLAGLLNIDASDLTEKLSNGPQFQYLKRKLTQKESTALRELKAKGDLAGVNLVQEFGRSYPEGALAASLLGYVGVDNIGLAGIEYTFNNVLAPAIIGKTDEKTGASVYLTLDSVLQYEAEKIAATTLETNQATRVNILVSDAKSGEILVWATSPGFDLNHVQGVPDEVRNNALQTRAYEPGSVFKVFSLSTMLDAGVLKPTDTFEANGFYEHTIASTGEVIRIRDLASYGRIDVAGILLHSSNAGTGYASDRIEAAPFEAGLRRYGFGQSTAISLNGETPGILQPSTTWSGRSKPTIAMGQEIGVSALQIVQAASVLANAGVMVKPWVVSRVVSATGEVLVENSRTEVRQVIQAKTAALVLDMLKGTVETGTGKRARIEGYDLAGKTGTAQVRDPATGRYSDLNYLASVLLYLPAEAPRYIIYLTIEHPLGASYLGGQIAAPVGKQIAEKLIQLKALPRTGEDVVSHSGSVRVEVPKPLVIGDSLPDLTGLSKRALLPLLSRPDLQVRLQGQGWVVRQSPAAGTPLTAGLVVTVELE
ncbi:MAG: penicillin-binding protein [Spirochaetales bacterium]